MQEFDEIAAYAEGILARLEAQKREAEAQAEARAERTRRYQRAHRLDRMYSKRQAARGIGR